MRQRLYGVLRRTLPPITADRIGGPIKFQPDEEERGFPR